jgi:hypothetical protein
MSVPFELPAYDPATMMNPATAVLVVGRRGRGKTTMMLHLLQGMADKLHACHVVCPISDTQEAFARQALPSHTIYDEFYSVLLEKICVDRGSHVPHIGVVLDDCVYDSEDFNKPMVRYFMQQGKTDNVFAMVSVEHIVDLPAYLRSVVNTVIVFPEADFEYRMLLRKTLLARAFYTDGELECAFQSLGQHEALVFDTNAHRKKRPHLFRIKAPVYASSFHD